MHTPQQHLVSLLKKKGTGKTMSKHLTHEECDDAFTLLLNPTALLATKVTLIVAFLMLESSTEETDFLNQLQKSYTSLPEECHAFFDQSLPSDVPEFMTLIRRVMNYEDLSEIDTSTALRFCLDKDIPTYLKAAFLEAERLKEESPIENRTILHGLWHTMPRKTISVPVLINIASAYDGFNRHPNLLLCLAPLLSSLGFSVLIHGAEEVGPKYGVTPHQLLKAMGHNPLLSMDDACKRLQDPSIGWAYIDQNVYYSDLDALRTCRKEMVKRPVLATVEKFLQPIVTSQRNIMLTGFTHPPYRQKTIDLIQSLPQQTDAFIVRGMEGSSLCPMDRRCPAITMTNGHVQEGFVSPQDIEKPLHDRYQPHPGITVHETASVITQLLNGEDHPMLDVLCYNAHMICRSLSLPITSFDDLKKKFKSGEVNQYFYQKQ